MIQHTSEGAPCSDQANTQLQALLDGLTPTHQAGSTGQAEDRQTLEAYVRSTPHPAEALASCLNEVRLRPPHDEAYVRGLLGQSEGCPSTQQAYQSLVEQAQQAWDGVRLQSMELEGPGLLHRRAALDAALCAWGPRLQETQIQLKGVMRALLAQDMVAEASVMAVELCCGHGQLDETADADLIVGAPRLFRPGLEAGPSRAREVYLSVGRGVLHRFAHFLAPEAAATLREAAAQLSPAERETPSTTLQIPGPPAAASQTGEPPDVMTSITFPSVPPPAANAAADVSPTPVIPLRPPPLTPDARLTMQVTQLLASVGGPHEDVIYARVEAQILELQRVVQKVVEARVSGLEIFSLSAQATSQADETRKSTRRKPLSVYLNQRRPIPS